MNTEVLAVGKLMSELGKSNYLNASHINCGDTEPSWDGNVYVYSNPDKRNDGDIRKIPIQVKGKGISNEKPAKNGKFTYSVEKKYLLNYKRDGGVLFFVVLIDKVKKEGVSIYYSDLSVVRLHQILLGKQSIKINTKIKFEIYKLSSDILQIEQLFINFSNTCENLSGFDKLKIELENMPNKPIKQITFYPTGDMMLPKNPHDLVGETFSIVCEFADGDHRIPSSLATIGSVITSPIKKQVKISIDDVIYFTEAEVSETSNTFDVKLGKCISISYPPKNSDLKGDVSRKIKFNHRFGKGETFKERINAIRFISHAIKKKGYEINGSFYNHFEYLNFAPYNKELVNELEICEKIERLFLLLNIPMEIDLTILSRSDTKTLDTLIYVLIDGGLVNNKENDPFTFVLDFCRYKFALQNEMSDIKGKHKVLPFSPGLIKNKVDISLNSDLENEPKYPVPCYHLFSPEQLMQLTNIDFDDLYNEYINISDDNPYKLEIIYWLCLDLLKLCNEPYYNKDKALVLIQKFIKWEIINYGEDIESTINLLQVYKRVRNLTEGERNKLFEITDKKIDNQYKVSAYLLLDNHEQAGFHFNKLTDEQKDDFKQSPVYHFWNAHVK